MCVLNNYAMVFISMDSRLRGNDGGVRVMRRSTGIDGGQRCWRRVQVMTGYEYLIRRIYGEVPKCWQMYSFYEKPPALPKDA